jgi:hypothetical protein
MLAVTNIRPRTAADREAAQERYDNRYERISGEVEAELRAEWDEQSVGDFGPYKPNHTRIHEITVARIAQESDYDH